MFKKTALLPQSLFFFIFVIYFLGISNSVYGGDSGDIILAAFFGGVAHPPGYPLNSILGYFFTHLPIAASVAYKANIMMALFSAGTIVLLFLTLKRLFGNVFIALSAASILAFSPLFWLYAHVTEVFQLNVFLISVSVYFLILWKDKKPQKYLLASIFFLGLAVFHHQTAVLVIPAYLYLIHKTGKDPLGMNRQSLKLIAAFLLGSFPYIFVPLLALRHTPVNWDNATSLGNLINLVTRADYGTFVASSSFAGTNYQARLLQVISYFAFAKNDFTIVGSLFILVGVSYTFMKNRKMFWFLFLAAFFTGPFFLFYSSFSLSSDFLFGIWERFILLSYFFLTIFLGYGLYFFYIKASDIYKRRLNLPIRKEVFLIIIQFSFLLPPLYMIVNNWPKADMSNFKLGNWLGHDVLASSASGSLIFLFDDTTAFNTQYIYYTNREFTDRKIVLGGILRHQYYRQQLAKEYPDLVYPSGFFDKADMQSATYMTQLIKANLSKVPVYTVAFSPKIESYGWVVSGLLKRLVVDSQVTDKEFIKGLNEKAIAGFALKANEADLGYGNFIPQSIKRFYAFSFNDIGDQMLAVKNFSEAKDYYWTALKIQPNDPRASFGIGRASLELGDCESAKTFLLRSYEQNKENTRVLDVLADEARRCEHSEELAKQYEDEAKKVGRMHMEEL